MQENDPEQKRITVPSIRIVGQDWPNVTILRSAYMTNPSVWALASSTEDGEPLSAFSVNLEDEPAEGCVWLKSWSEGEGVPEELVRLGIVELTGRTTRAGYSTAIEARVLGDLA